LLPTVRLGRMHPLFPYTTLFRSRPATEILHGICETRACTNAGAKLLVGRFEPRRDVDGIAVSSVVEEPAAAEIPDDCRSGMHPRSEEHTSELQSHLKLVCRLLRA